MDPRSPGPSKRKRLTPPTILATMGCVFAAAGCSTMESPFAPDSGIEETPRLSLSEEPPSAEEPPAAAIEVPSSPGGESGESSVDAVDVQPKLAPRISRVSIPPLVVIDGVVQPDHFRLSDIRHLDIDHVEVVKGAAALQLYGPRAKGGAIDIRTNAGRKPPS
ncbi:TonB-dependent receptor [Candidatus Palauibacter sp.]|uniref:TonB-dependent receptor n=1 Tax=Candidatus Palauibacter sp. TaxID=3101350 RepID=UPI003B028D94